MDGESEEATIATADHWYLFPSPHALRLTILIITSNVTLSTAIQFLISSNACMYRLFASVWRRLVSVITTLYYVAIIFYRQVWYRALSLRYACMCSLVIILIH